MFANVDFCNRETRCCLPYRHRCIVTVNQAQVQVLAEPPAVGPRVWVVSVFRQVPEPTLRGRKCRVLQVHALGYFCLQLAWKRHRDISCLLSHGKVSGTKPWNIYAKVMFKVFNSTSCPDWGLGTRESLLYPYSEGSHITLVLLKEWEPLGFSTFLATWINYLGSPSFSL